MAAFSAKGLVGLWPLLAQMAVDGDDVDDDDDRDMLLLSLLL